MNTTIRGSFFYSIAETRVPAFAHPQRTSKISPSNNDATDLSGRPIGYSGKETYKLEWDLISAEGLQWWQEREGDRFDIVLPDPTSKTIVSRNNQSYPNHTHFVSGHVWPAQVEASLTAIVNKMYLQGTITIKITNLV